MYGVLMGLSDHKLREKVVERMVKGYAKKQGWTVRKFTSPGKRAVSDNIFFKFPGVAFFIEFKAPGKEPTKSQLLEHGEMRNCGFRVYVVGNIGEGMDIIDAENLKLDKVSAMDMLDTDTL